MQFDEHDSHLEANGGTDGLCALVFDDRQRRRRLQAASWVMYLGNRTRRENYEKSMVIDDEALASEATESDSELRSNDAMPGPPRTIRAAAAIV